MSDTAPSTSTAPTSTEGGSTTPSTETSGNPDLAKPITRKVDGQVVTETRQQIIERLSKLPDEELASWDSISAASQKRFDLSARQLKETTERSRQMDEFVSALDSDDPQVTERAFQKLGKDAKKIALKLAYHHYQRDKATPQQRKEMELSERERTVREREQAEEQKTADAKLSQEVDDLYDQLYDEVTEVFAQAGVEMDEEAQAELVPRVAFYLDSTRKSTGHLPTTHEVVAFIRKIDGARSEKATKPMLAALEAGDLTKLTPKAKEALRKAMIAEFSTETPSEGKRPNPPSQRKAAEPWQPKVYKAGEPDSFKKTLD